MRYVSFWVGDDTNRRICILYRLKVLNNHMLPRYLLEHGTSSSNTPSLYTSPYSPFVGLDGSIIKSELFIAFIL